MSSKHSSKTIKRQFQRDTLVLRLFKYWPFKIDNQVYLVRPESIDWRSFWSWPKLWDTPVVDVWADSLQIQELLKLSASDMHLLDISMLNRMGYAINKLKSWQEYKDAAQLFPKEWKSKGKTIAGIENQFQAQLQQCKTWMEEAGVGDKKGVEVLLPNHLSKERQSLQGSIWEPYFCILYWLTDEKYLKYCIGLYEQLIADWPSAISKETRGACEQFMICLMVSTKARDLPPIHSWYKFFGEYSAAEIQWYEKKDLSHSFLAIGEMLRKEPDRLPLVSEYFDYLFNYPLVLRENGEVYRIQREIEWLVKGASLSLILQLNIPFGRMLDASFIPKTMQNINRIHAWVDWLILLKELPASQKEEIFAAFDPEKLNDSLSVSQAKILTKLAERLCSIGPYLQKMNQSSLAPILNHISEWVQLGVDKEQWTVMQEWLSPQGLPRISTTGLTNDKQLKDQLRLLAYYRQSLGQSPLLPQSITKLKDQATKLKKQLAYITAKAEEEGIEAWGERLANLQTYQQELPQFQQKELKNKLANALPQAMSLRLQQLVRKQYLYKLGVEVPELVGVFKKAPINSSRVLLQYLFGMEGVRESYKKAMKNFLLAAAQHGAQYKMSFEFNRNWLDKAANEYKLNGEAWLSVKPWRQRVGEETITIYDSKEPAEFLLMGNYFDTCLALPGGMNAAAVATNATDINKKLLIAKNAKGHVVGRKLIAINEIGQLIGYHNYGNVGGEDEMAEVFTGYCEHIAQESGLVLGNTGKPENLCKGFWYDDGVVFFQRVEQDDLFQQAEALLHQYPKEAIDALRPYFSKNYFVEKSLHLLIEKWSNSHRNAIVDWSVQLAASQKDIDYLLQVMSFGKATSYTLDAWTAWSEIVGEESIDRLKGLAEHESSYEIMATRCLWKLKSPKAIEALAYLVFECISVADSLISYYALSYRPLQEAILEQYYKYTTKNQPYVNAFLEVFPLFDRDLLESNLHAVLEMVCSPGSYDDDALALLWRYGKPLDLRSIGARTQLFKKHARRGHWVNVSYKSWQLLGAASPKQMKKLYEERLEKSLGSPLSGNDTNGVELAMHAYLMQVPHIGKPMLEELKQKMPYSPEVLWAWWMRASEEEQEAEKKRLELNKSVTRPTSWKEVVLLATWMSKVKSFDKEDALERLEEVLVFLEEYVSRNSHESLWISVLNYCLEEELTSPEASIAHRLAWAPIISVLSYDNILLWQFSQIGTLAEKCRLIERAWGRGKFFWQLPHIVEQIGLSALEVGLDSVEVEITKSKNKPKKSKQKKKTEGYWPAALLSELMTTEEEVAYLEAIESQGWALGISFSIGWRTFELFGHGHFNTDARLLGHTREWNGAWEEYEFNGGLRHLVMRALG